MRLAALVLAFGWVFGASPARSTCVVSSLQDRLKSIESASLNEEDTRAIATLFADPARPPEEKARTAFEIALAARLRGLSPGEQQAVQQAYATMEKVHSKGAINGFTSMSNGEIHLKLPEALQGSLVEQYVAFHELEHFLQYYHLRQDLPYWRRTLSEMLDVSGRNQYLGEEGAMRAEWLLLHGIPADVRESLAQVIEQSPEISARDRKVHARSLRAAGEDVEKYLEIQRKGGRYSRAQLAVLHGLPKVELAGGAIVIAVIKACRAWVDPRGNYRDPSLFQRGCLKLREVQELLDIRRRLHDARSASHAASGK